MPDLYFDFGNADVKWYTGVGESNEERYGYFRHAIAELSEAQWNEALGRSRQPPDGYIAIHDGGLTKFFALGDKARRYVNKNRPKGADRYRNDYYGIAFAYAVSKAYEPNIRKINLYASHAPQDIQYADDLENAVIGGWSFTTAEGHYSIVVDGVETFDEPLGGLNHYMLTTKGVSRQKNPHAQSTILVLDIGGYTCDVAAIDPGGVIDESMLSSTRVGVIEQKVWFEREIRTKHKEAFKTAGDLDPLRIETALNTGYYPYGKRKLDCKDLSEQAKTSLTNDVVEVLVASGGVANFDVVLLTGGGAALIVDRLRKIIKDIDFVMVEDNRDNVRYANVFGGAKLFRMLRLMGAL